MKQIKPTHYLLALILVLWAMIPAMGGEREATVVQIKDGGCTGVIFSSQGHFFTAKHCIRRGSRSIDPASESVEVHVGDRVVKAVRVYVSPSIEGPVVYDLEGEGYQFAPIFRGQLNIGDNVYTIGHPGDNPENKAKIHGKLTRRGISNGVHFHQTDFPTLGGMSGGPLFTKSGELIGLLSMTGRDHSMWIRVEELRLAYLEVGAGLVKPKKRTVYVYTIPECEPCARFKMDASSGKFTQFQFKYVSADEFHKHSGKFPESAPSFYTQGQPPKSGYSGPKSFLGWLRSVIRGILRLPLSTAEAGEQLISGEGPDVGHPELGEPTPPDQIAQVPGPPPLEPAPKPVSGFTVGVKADIESVKGTLSDLIEDVKKFKDAGMIGKVALIGELKRDAADAKAIAEVAKAEATQAKADFDRLKEDGKPNWLAALLSLLGVFKRRYLSSEGVGEN